MGRIARMLALACIILLTSLAASAQTLSGRDRLNRSAGWGVDRDTGNIVVDASLIVLYDPLNQTLVVNPNYLQDALAETGAQVQKDGSWLFPDGSVIRPLVGKAAIVLGDEPAGLLEASGLPPVAYEKVNLVDRVGPAAADPGAARSSGRGDLVPPLRAQGGDAMKLRHSHRCAGCASGCGFKGCDGNLFFTDLAPAHGNCEFKLFHRCREDFKVACQVDFYNCINCVGGLQPGPGNPAFLYGWQCTGGC